MARARFATRPSLTLARHGVVVAALMMLALSLGALASPTATGASLRDPSPESGCGAYVHQREPAGCDDDLETSTTSTSSPSTSSPPTTSSPTSSPTTSSPTSSPPTGVPATSPPPTGGSDVSEPPTGTVSPSTEPATSEPLATTTTVAVPVTPAPVSAEPPDPASIAHQPDRDPRPWPRVRQPTGPTPLPAPLLDADVTPLTQVPADVEPSAESRRPATIPNASTGTTPDAPSSPVATVTGSDVAVATVPAHSARVPPRAERFDGGEPVAVPGAASPRIPTITAARPSSSGIGAEWSALMASTVAALIGAWYAFRKRPPVVAATPGAVPLPSE